MNKQTTKRAVAVAVVGAVMLGSVPPSWAAPISSSMTILKQAAPSSGVTDVRYRAIIAVAAITANPGAAIGLGILGAAAGAAAYGAYGAYGPGYYGPGYYAPGYYGTPYPYRRDYYYRY